MRLHVGCAMWSLKSWQGRFTGPGEIKETIKSDPHGGTHVALELGLGDLAALGPADRAMVDRQTDETIEGCSADTDEPADCSDADRTMRRLLSEHRALEELRAIGLL